MAGAGLDPEGALRFGIELCLDHPNRIITDSKYVMEKLNLGVESTIYT